MEAPINSYRNIDLGFSSTVQPKINQVSANTEESVLCPKHVKVARKKKTTPSEENKTKPRISAMKRVFGKSLLEQKLENHGIKMKITLNSKRKILPDTGEK